ncbi:MAG: ferredoxin reductase [Solirubrobacteraceae bacterium]|nr:ferredoxin reductase [Solirubrobacteraceae bacterium]
MRRRLLRAARTFTTPLLPDDYLELINPLWSARELRGRIERIEPETPWASTVVIRPGWEWPGHRPGQYLRVGVDIDGVRCWRAYSLTSDPGAKDGMLRITPKLVEGGQVSPFLVREATPGMIVGLGGVEGTFVLPDPAPAKVLFVTAGSGVTPVMSMLRALERRAALRDVVHIHSARTADEVIFGTQLRGMAMRSTGLTLIERRTGDDGRATPGHLDELCPDWREREAFVCGPADMLDDYAERYAAEGLSEQLHTERFQPTLSAMVGQGAGGEIAFTRSRCSGESDGNVPILEAGERAGARLPYGCRMGICHTCVGFLRSGQVRDLRTGEVLGAPGDLVRTCVNAPEGPIEIDL